MLRWLLVAYFVGSVVVAVALVFDVAGHSGELAATTSGKILAAALLAMGLGALGAARDPRRERLMIKVIIVFTTLAVVAIVYRLAAEHHPHDLAWLVLPFAVAAPVLFVLFYPRRD